MSKYYAIEVAQQDKPYLLLRELPETKEAGDHPIEYQQRVYDKALGVMTELELGRLLGMHYMLGLDSHPTLVIYHTADDPYLKVTACGKRDALGRSHMQVSKEKILDTLVDVRTDLSVLYFHYKSDNPPHLHTHTPE